MAWCSTLMPSKGWWNGRQLLSWDPNQSLSWARQRHIRIRSDINIRRFRSDMVLWVDMGPCEICLLHHCQIRPNWKLCRPVWNTFRFWLSNFWATLLQLWCKDHMLRVWRYAALIWTLQWFCQTSNWLLRKVRRAPNGVKFERMWWIDVGRLTACTSLLKHSVKQNWMKYGSL